MKFICLVVAKPSTHSHAISSSISKSSTATCTTFSASSSIIEQFNISVLHILPIFGHGFGGISFSFKVHIGFSSRSSLIVKLYINTNGIYNRAKPFGDVIFGHAERQTAHVNHMACCSAWASTSHSAGAKTSAHSEAATSGHSKAATASAHSEATAVTKTASSEIIIWTSSITTIISIIV